MSTLDDHTQLFARIRVHGLTKLPSGDSCPIKLKRWTSFPAPSEVMDDSESPISSSENTDLSSRALSPKFEVDARVRFDTPQTSMYSPEGSLGSGRAGIVYPLEVVSIRCLPSPTSTGSADEECVDPTSISLPPLCIKVASPGYARALAREAWFYEQIDASGLTGILAPRCYGVFRAFLGNASSSAGITVDIPEYDYYEAAAQPIYCDSQLYTSVMAEEEYDRETNALGLSPYFIDDSKRSYKSSPWTNLRETPETTALTVLIMDQLGEPLTAEAMDKHIDDLSLLYDHLIPLRFSHDDHRFPNILRVPPHLQVQCPLHRLAHSWNLVDWENATAMNQGGESTFNAKVQRSHLTMYYRGHGGKKRYDDLNW